MVGWRCASSPDAGSGWRRAAVRVDLRAEVVGPHVGDAGRVDAVDPGVVAGVVLDAGRCPKLPGPMEMPKPAPPLTRLRTKRVSGGVDRGEPRVVAAVADAVLAHDALRSRRSALIPCRGVEDAVADDPRLASQKSTRDAAAQAAASRHPRSAASAPRCWRPERAAELLDDADACPPVDTSVLVGVQEAHRVAVDVDVVAEPVDRDPEVPGSR